MEGKVIAVVDATGRCLVETPGGLAVIDVLSGEIALNDSVQGEFETGRPSTLFNISQGGVLEVCTEVMNASAGLVRLLLGLV